MSPDVIGLGAAVFGVLELALFLWLFSKDRSPDLYRTRMQGVAVLSAIGIGATLTPGYLLALHVHWGIGLAAALKITAVATWLISKLVDANNKSHSS